MLIVANPRNSIRVRVRVRVRVRRLVVDRRESAEFKGIKGKVVAFDHRPRRGVVQGPGSELKGVPLVKVRVRVRIRIKIGVEVRVRVRVPQSVEDTGWGRCRLLGW